MKRVGARTIFYLIAHEFKVQPMCIRGKWRLPDEVVGMWPVRRLAEYQEYLRQYFKARYASPKKGGSGGKGVGRHAFQWKGS